MSAIQVVKAYRILQVFVQRDVRVDMLWSELFFLVTTKSVVEKTHSAGTDVVQKLSKHFLILGLYIFYVKETKLSFIFFYLIQECYVKVAELEQKLTLVS